VSVLSRIVKLVWSLPLVAVKSVCAMSYEPACFCETSSVLAWSRPGCPCRRVGRRPKGPTRVFVPSITKCWRGSAGKRGAFGDRDTTTIWCQCVSFQPEIGLNRSQVINVQITCDVPNLSCKIIAYKCPGSAPRRLHDFRGQPRSECGPSVTLPEAVESHPEM